MAHMGENTCHERWGGPELEDPSEGGKGEPSLESCLLTDTCISWTDK